MNLGLELPPGYRLASLAEEPDLRGVLGEHQVAVWPAFMLEDQVADRLWHHLFEEFAAFQVCLLDADGRVVAGHNSAPLAWDGTDAGLPVGWDDQFERSVADRAAGRAPTALGALQIVVRPDRQGAGLSGLMLEAMSANAAARGFGAVIACVRPTWKERYPLTPIERYIAWTRGDGLPFDPWIRVHVRLGGRIVRPSPRSMTIEGSVDEWERWTEMAFPESGTYVVRGGAAPVTIDRASNRGVYHDPNVWIVHALDA